MQAQTAPQDESHNAPPLLDKAFFGKDNCLALQVRAGSCFLRWGKKTGESWSWKNVKFSDVECGEIVRVLEGEQSEASFFHSFAGQSTKVWVSRQDDAVVLRADDFTKGLQRGEQVVLALLLRNSIWMLNLPGFVSSGAD